MIFTERRILTVFRIKIRFSRKKQMDRPLWSLLLFGNVQNDETDEKKQIIL